MVKNSRWKTYTIADVILDGFKQLLGMFPRNNLVIKM